MVDLAPGSVVRVVNPSPVVQVSAPGVVKSLWLKEGPTGPTGLTGPTNTLTIGTVTTGAAGSPAASSVTGTAPNQTLNLTIPKGDTGATGPQGPAGSVTYGTTAGTAAEGNDPRITGAAQRSANLSDLTSAPVARGNLGLGSAALKTTGTGAGQIPVLSGTPGTPDGTKFLRDDGTWAAVSAGGGGGLLASKSHDPTTTLATNTSSTTFVDIDATNLTVTFTAPASGSVILRLSAVAGLGATGAGYWSVASGGVIVSQSRVQTIAANSSTSGVLERRNVSAKIAGLTPGSSYTWTWRHRTDNTGTFMNFRAGGNSDTAVSAYGPALMEVWSA